MQQQLLKLKPERHHDPNHPPNKFLNKMRRDVIANLIEERDN